MTPVKRGTARSAWANQDFRRLYVASFASNAGRWMQNTTLGVLAWELTGSSTYLGLLIFATLAPLAVLSLIGGSLADTVDRRKLLLSTQVWQMVWSFVLAAMVVDGQIGEVTLLALVFVIGLGQGIYAPAFVSILPTLAGPGNMPAAIAMNSAQINAARVVGPALGGWLVSQFGFAEVFALNAGTYLFVIIAIWITPMPSPVSSGQSLGDRIFGGFRVAYRAPQVGQPLVIMTTFTFLCLPFIGQLPAIAEVNLGIDAQSTQYGYFYALFGAGALAGAIASSTLFLNIAPSLMLRLSFIGFGVSLLWLALVNEVELAYGAITSVGFFYFMLPVILATAWQEHVDDSVRGRIAALWVLSFGGAVPLANLVAGPIVEATSLEALMIVGAVAAFVLAFTARLRGGPVVGEAILAE
ncbi:MAG: MFS transporter [Acidimicrobiales bacterium]